MSWTSPGSRRDRNDESVEQVPVLCPKLRDLSPERADSLARLRVRVVEKVPQLDRYQAREIALCIGLEVRIGPGNATACLVAEEHLDGATSMDLTAGEDHLHGVLLVPTRSNVTYFADIGPNEDGKIGSLT